MNLLSLGINWKLILIKIGLALALIAGVSYISYEKGQASVRVDVAEKAAKDIEVRTVIMMETIEKRIPVIQYIERENAKLEAEVKDTKRRLDEAIKASSDVLECRLTNDEWLRFNEAARAIKRSATLPEFSAGGS